jgi:hypothetical protein
MVTDLMAHQGKPTQVEHIRIDMSPAYISGVQKPSRTRRSPSTRSN